MDVVIAVAFIVSSCQQVRLSRQFKLIFFHFFFFGFLLQDRRVSKALNGLSMGHFVQSLFQRQRENFGNFLKRGFV